MARRIALVTDSTCDIPADWREKYDITVVPLTIVFDGQPYLDGVDLTAEEFYQRLLVDRTFPTTSQPTPKAFLEAYQQETDLYQACLLRRKVPRKSWSSPSAVP